MIQIKVKRPMLICAIALALCAALAGKLGLVYLFIAIPIIFALLYYLLDKVKFALVVLLAILIFVLSFVQTTSKINETRKFCYSSYTLNLLATKDPEIKSNNYGQVEVLALNNGKLPDRQKFILYFNNSLPVRAGDEFLASVKIEPLDTSEAKLYYYSNNVHYKLRLINFYKVNSNSRLYSTLNEIRNTVEDKLFLNMTSDTASTMCAITYGDDSYISEEFANNVRRAGVSHVMVVSGMHLAIIMSGIFSVLDRLFYNRYLRCLLSAFCVFLICGICGFTMSVTRAGLMYVLAAFAPLVFRENDSVNTLGTTVCIILIANPYAIFSLSFLLSVSATYGVVGLAPFYSELLSLRVHKENFVLRGAISLILNTICAMLMTLPITIYCFSEVSLIAPLTNLAISYPVTWALTIVFYALIFSFLPFVSLLAKPLFKIAEFFVRYINIIINDFGSAKYSAISVDKGYFVVAIIVILLLVVFMYYKQDNILFNKKEGKKNACTVRRGY